jgi:hypothetical protein
MLNLLYKRLRQIIHPVLVVHALHLVMLHFGHLLIGLGRGILVVSSARSLA